MDLQPLNPLRWKKSFLVAILLAFITIWFVFLDSYSLYTRYELNQRKTEMEMRIGQLAEETARLEQKLEELENDSRLLEKIAREEYGMRKPGETVYIIREQ